MDTWHQEVKKLEREIDINSIRLAVLAEKESLLLVNKNLGGKESPALEQLKEGIIFFDKELSKIKSEVFEIEEKNDELEDQKYRIEQQIASINSTDDKPKGEIIIRLDSDAATTGKFTITYQVEHAGWFPKYDLQVSNINEPLNLRYKADIYQNTGVDWNNVKLRLSNATPNQSGLAPKLSTWHLNYARNTVYQQYYNGKLNNNIRNVAGRVTDDTQEGLPGVNVIVKGTTVGTTTDFDGNYSLTLPEGATMLVFSFIGMVPQELPITSSNISTQLDEDFMHLEEVVVSAYGIERPAGNYGYRHRRERKAEVITTSVIENQTTVEFEVEEPYSIQSEGDKLTVDLTSFEINAIYEYFASPKLDNDAFLMAYITDWDQYNLLEGEANLYFEDTYVGRTILNAKALTDTLSISMGRDKSIVIGRTKIDDFTKMKTIGGNQIESRGYQIFVRNKKSQPIHLTLTDQVPIAAISAISVDVKDLSGGKLEESTGLITWDLELGPKEQKEVTFAYTVKYPRKELVNVE